MFLLVLQQFLESSYEKFVSFRYSRYCQRIKINECLLLEPELN